MAGTELEVVEHRCLCGAPTGEGNVVRTSDGRWWKKEGVSNYEPLTGVNRGWLVGSKVVPYDFTVGSGAKL